MLYPDVFHWKHNVTSYALAELDQCIGFCTSAGKNLVQARFLAHPTFRTKVAGAPYHRFGVSPVGLKKMTCHERCAAIMYYPHALGSQCLVLPEELRAPAMRAMRLVQVMLIAMGNARPLTRREAKMVFCACGRQLFLVLSELNRLTTELRIARNRRGRGRVRLHVSVPRDPLETDATADTASEEDNPPGHTRYVRGQMAVPGHCFDFPELLRRSGGFHNHSAEIGEATHPTAIRSAC